MSETTEPSRMRPTPEDLADTSRYVLLDEVAHENLVPAVQAHLKRSSPIKAAYILMNVVVLGAIAFLWVKTGTPFFTELPTLCLGMCLGYLLLLPVHEGIHALTYRWLGAKGTRIVYTLRNLTAYCVADRFVVDGREFAWVCLMPFLVLNTILLVVIAAVGGFQPLLWGMLLLHVGACSGDFAFVNLAWAHRNDGLLTYDDVSGKRTLFYTSRPPVLTES
jgi:hypothetical protein